MTTLTDEQLQPIVQLIEKFESERNLRQSEADVRAGYIDLLFHVLGWNIYNDPGQATNYRREGYVRDAGYVDVGLEIGGQPVLFLEAKRFGRIPASSERTGDRTTEEKQAFRYARGKRISYAILTNFERLHVFNADHERLILAFDHPRQYLDRLQDLRRLSPEQVEGGSLRWWEGQLEKKDIDLEFLAALRRWRLLLANAIYQHNAENPALQRDGVFDFDTLMAAVQRILDRLILVRYGDDKEVLLAHDLLDTMLVEYRNRGAYARPDHLVRAFIDLSHMMDEHHNTTLFAPGHLCEQVSVPNQVLADVIDQMNGISFRKFTSDILGNTYESYLGTKLALRNGAIGDEERRDIRKGRGIYYTPRWVVAYIVDNTLGKRLRELEEKHGLRAVEEVRGLAVLDPACGSGSFLIYAYQVLADFYRRMNRAIGEEQARLLEQLRTPQMDDFLEQFKSLPQPVLDFPQVILKEHLYGVDLDPEAAEIAAVNLTMQAFADSRREKLPLILNENIKVGNSLISGSEDELGPYFGDAWHEKRPFNWDQEFREIMARGGFDIVVGNPPYVRPHKLDTPTKAYLRQHFTTYRAKSDIYHCFMEQAVRLSRTGGILSFITGDNWRVLQSAERLRSLVLHRCSILQLATLPPRVFQQAAVQTLIFVTQKIDPEGLPTNHLVEVVQLPDGDQTRYIPQKLFSDRPGLILDLTLTERVDLRDKIQQRGEDLSHLVTIDFGLKTGHDATFIRSTSTRPEDRPLVRGGGVDRYSLHWAHEYVWYVPQQMRSHRKTARPGERERFECPKILIRDTSYTIRATYDEDNFYAKDVLILHTPQRPCSLKYLLSILNSTLMAFYYNSRYTSIHVNRNETLNLPIRPIDFDNPDEKAVHDALATLAQRMLDLHQRLAAKGDVHDNEREQIERDIARTDREIDDLVYDLYGLTAQERDLIESEVRR